MKTVSVLTGRLLFFVIIPKSVQGAATFRFDSDTSKNLSSCNSNCVFLVFPLPPTCTVCFAAQFLIKKKTGEDMVKCQRDLSCV